MEKLDIQVISIPRKELVAWWKGMSKDNQTYVQERLRYLLELMHVEHHVSLVQALAHFWEVSTVTPQTPSSSRHPTLVELLRRPRNVVDPTQTSEPHAEANIKPWTER